MQYPAMTNALQTGLGRLPTGPSDALHHVAQRPGRPALPHRRVDRLALLHRHGQPRGDPGRRGGRDPRQGRRIRRQFLEGQRRRPERGQREGADLLRPTHHQEGQAARGPRLLSGLRQLIRPQPHTHLQSAAQGE